MKTNFKPMSYYLMNPLKVEFIARKAELKSYVNAIFNNSETPKNKFILFCHSRTGSTLLIDLLNSHPEILCRGEVFGPFNHSIFKKVLFPHLFLKGLYTNSEKLTFGCNIKLYQLNNSLIKRRLNPNQFITDLHNNGWKIIHLTRLNTLRQGISHVAARTRNNYNFKKSGQKIPEKVIIDCNMLNKRLKWIEIANSKEKHILRNIPHIKIIYEKHLLREDDHQDTLNKIFKYIGVNPAPVKSDYIRISSDELSDYIENHHEVIEFINKTQYSEYLNAYHP